MKMTKQQNNEMNNLLAPFWAFIVLEFGFAMAFNVLYEENEDDNPGMQSFSINNQ